MRSIPSLLVYFVAGSPIRPLSFQSSSTFTFDLIRFFFDPIIRERCFSRVCVRLISPTAGHRCPHSGICLPLLPFSRNSFHFVPPVVVLTGSRRMPRTHSPGALLRSFSGLTTQSLVQSPAACPRLFSFRPLDFRQLALPQTFTSLTLVRPLFSLESSSSSPTYVTLARLRPW